MTLPQISELPGLDCGLCGLPTCAEFARRLPLAPDLVKRCVHLAPQGQAPRAERPPALKVVGPGEAATPVSPSRWVDSLGREFDFVLRHFPHEPGPREIILPHNPLITREMEVVVGDVLIGRPLGMSCGCPVTHCGVTMDVDRRTGVTTWCVTGPLRPRAGLAPRRSSGSSRTLDRLLEEERGVPAPVGRHQFLAQELERVRDLDHRPGGKEDEALRADVLDH